MFPRHGQVTPTIDIHDPFATDTAGLIAPGTAMDLGDQEIAKE